jgi:hypothetical protein
LSLFVFIAWRGVESLGKRAQVRSVKHIFGFDGLCDNALAQPNLFRVLENVKERPRL